MLSVRLEAIGKMVNVVRPQRPAASIIAARAR